MNHSIRFNRTERSIIISLLFIFLCLVSYRYYIVYIHDYEELKDTNHLVKAEVVKDENSSLKKPSNETSREHQPTNKPYQKTYQQKTNEKPSNRPKKYTSQFKKKDIKLFSFDPNMIDSSGLTKLGFRDYVIKNMLNYRRAGGRFKQKSDLKKVYGMTDNFYVKLEKHIQISEATSSPKKEKQKNNNNLPSKKIEEKIDINTCSFAQLMRLDSIETKIAGRILKYRDKLGGFHSIKQLEEVYEMPLNDLEKWVPRLTISPVELPKVSINFASVDELAKLPYLSPKQAKTLKNYINQHGAIINKTDLEPIKILDDALIAKLDPYLSYDDGTLVSKETKVD